MNHSQNKPSDRATPGPGSLNAILRPGALACLLSVLLVGCAPRLTETEVRCLASVEVRESLELAACGKDTEGACSTDAIMDKYDPEALACVQGGAQ